MMSRTATTTAAADDNNNGSSRWVLSADISSVGRKRLRVFAEHAATRRRTQSVDSAALELILGACAAGAVRDVEGVLALLEEGGRLGRERAERSGNNDNNNNIATVNSQNNAHHYDSNSALNQQHSNERPTDAASKILLRYAVLSEAFQRERQGSDILGGALAAALAALEAARDELDEVRAERDALRAALTGK
jgi:hypothetical protein